MAHLRTSLAFTGHGDTPTPRSSVWQGSGGPHAEVAFTDPSGHAIALNGPAHQVYALLRDAMNDLGVTTSAAIEAQPEAVPA